jgi:hypothetical protein
MFVVFIAPTRCARAVYGVKESGLTVIPVTRHLLHREDLLQFVASEIGNSWQGQTGL